MARKKEILNAEAMQSAVCKVAETILRDRHCQGDFVLVGIQQKGVSLARRLAKEILRISGKEVMLGKLDISMYRDDVGLRSGLPLIRETEIRFDMNDANVILVDDVLSSGRTIRAALDALTDYGRPRFIRLAVLADRGDPEFPIRADYVGENIFDVPPNRKISVEFIEDGDASSGVYQIDWSEDEPEIKTQSGKQGQ